MPAPTIATPIAMSSSAPFDPQRRSHRELPIALAARALTTDIDMLPVAVESKTSFVPLHIDTGWNCTNCHCVNESMATTCLECNLSRNNQTARMIRVNTQDVTDVAITDSTSSNIYLYVCVLLSCVGVLIYILGINANHIFPKKKKKV